LKELTVNNNDPTTILLEPFQLCWTYTLNDRLTIHFCSPVIA